MQSYDVFMLIVLVAATAWGAHKGLAWQIASLSSIFVSYAASLRYRATLAPMIRTDAPWNLLLAMLIIFLACNLGIWIAFRFVSEIIDRVKLKEFDRQIGGMIGFTKGVILCVIITMFAVSLSAEPQRRQIVESRSGHYISILLAKSHSWIPAEARQVVAPYVQKLEETLRREGGAAPTTTRDGPAPARIPGPDERQGPEPRWPRDRERIQFDPN